MAAWLIAVEELEACLSPHIDLRVAGYIQKFQITYMGP